MYIEVSDGHQMGVRFVTAQSTKHKHYIAICLSGVCEVIKTIIGCQVGVRCLLICVLQVLTNFSHDGFKLLDALICLNIFLPL